MVQWLVFLLLLFATVTFGLTAIAPSVIQPPATVSIDGGNLIVRVRGPYKLFALRSVVSVPLSSVQSVRVEPHARALPRGARVGTYVPGGTIAGNFGRGSSKAFWAVQNDEALVIELEGEKYRRIVVEVRDPAAARELIENSRS